MSDEFEHRLTVQLRERVPEPPRVCTAQEVWDALPPTRTPHRPATRIAAVVGATVVVLVVALTVSLRHTTHGPHVARRPPTSTTTSPTSPAVVTDPQALVGPIWSLRAFRPEPGEPVHVGPKVAPTIEISRSGTIEDNTCSIATSTLAAGRVVFHQPFVNGAVAGRMCGPRSSTVVLSDFYSVLGAGTVTWSITDDRLTVRQPAVGTLVFQGIRANATIAGRLLLTGGPAPSTSTALRPPAIGWVTLQKTSGSYPVRAKTDSQGRFAVAVTPGRWEVTGHWSDSQHMTSAARVDASANRTVNVKVYFEIR